MPYRNQLLSALLIMLMLCSSASGQGLGNLPFPKVAPLPKETPPPKLDSLEDLFPKTDLPFIAVQPVDLAGLPIAGLDKKYDQALGDHHFIVVNNTHFQTMSDLYRDNRLKGKSNYVTADSIIHPYFALNNAILAAVIRQELYPHLLSLLAAMLKTSLEDYKAADDIDVKQDIEKNLAFITVALKLLDPKLVLPSQESSSVISSGESNKLAENELKNIQAGIRVKSAISGCQEDYADYKPIGFYDSAPQLRQFYYCRQWLSHIAFPINDSGTISDPLSAPQNKFRQSVLLFRALDRAVVDHGPALQSWQNLTGILELLCPGDKIKKHYLMPDDYKKLLPDLNRNLDGVLRSLGDPFYRTKLLLSIRRSLPVELNSTSVWAPRQKIKEDDTIYLFRFLPLLDQPEISWLSELAHKTAAGSSASSSPMALFMLYAHGARLAANILAQIDWQLNPDLLQSLPLLLHATHHAIPLHVESSPDIFISQADNNEGVWSLLNSYMRLPPGIPQPLTKTELWMKRRLESAIGSWVDEHTAILSLPDDLKRATNNPTTDTASGADSPGLNMHIGAGLPENAGSTASLARTTDTAATARTSPTAASAPPAEQTQKRPVSHYLEPMPELYKSLAARLQKTTDDLTAKGIFPARFSESVQTYLAMCRRLATIAEREVTNMYVSRSDSDYLAQIDLTMEKFSPPTAGTLHLNCDLTADTHVGGDNLCLGGPGLLFVLIHTARGLTLGRGAVFTYYEAPGEVITPTHWSRKLQYGMVLPPAWTADFDVMQGEPQTH